MRLDVRLVDDVEAEPVAELEPVRVVRIVRRAHGVDVELLHQPHVPLHQLTGDCAAPRVVVIVPVDAGDEHRLAVDEQVAIANLDVAEAERGGDGLAAGVELERVERGLLRRPQSRTADLTVESPVLQLPLRHCPPALVDEAHLTLLGEHREPPVAAGAHLDVAHSRRHETDGARQPSVPPLVLILDEARIRPADDDGDELVRAVVANEAADVELRRRAGVLRDPDRLAVHQDVERTLGAAEVEDDRARAPAAGDRERPPVHTGLVLLGHVRRQIRKRHHDVRVMRPAEALHRPEAGHLDLPPATRALEQARSFFGPRRETELPAAVEVADARGAACERRASAAAG